MDSSDEVGMVIVGGGLAGTRAIETLRESGYDGPVTLIGAEPDLPYERPVLSKGYLLGSEPRESAFIHDRQWYDQQQVELVLGDAARAIDRQGHRVTTASGRVIDYRKLLLATGAGSRRLPVDGADAAHVHLLRDLGDAEGINAAIAAGGPLVIIGGGWIGLEVAAAARERGVEVTLLEAAAQPLLGVLGEEVASVFADLHREHGVRLITGAEVRQIETAAGTATAVRTADGERHPAAAVLVGIGAVPRTEIAERAGLEVQHGVLTDAALRTSDSDIHAAGDIAAVQHRLLGTRVRAEHWAWAHDTGPVAARAMLGEDAEVDFLPFFYTDQYDLGMEYIGYLAPGSRPRVEVRGDTSTREFAAYWVDGDRVVAGMHVNLWDSGIDPIKEIVQSGDPGQID